VGFVGFAYLPRGVLVRSVDKGLFRAGVGSGVCSSGRDRSDVGKVLRTGVYGGIGMVDAKVVYLQLVWQAHVFVAARVSIGVRCVGLTTGVGDALGARVCDICLGLLFRWFVTERRSSDWSCPLFCCMWV